MIFSAQGAWTRQAAAFDGGQAFETQYVYWLQAGPTYADLRVPFHPAADFRCFAGRSGWGDDGAYHWTHTLDLEPANPADAAELTWEDGRLVERGWWDDRRYEEFWVRLDDGDGPFTAAEAPDGRGCVVQAGAHALTVVDGRPAGGAFAACYRVLGPGGWTAAGGIGPAAGLPTPDDIPVDWLAVAVDA